ncbi:MAG: glycosyltransferase family 2 protein [Caldilineaceae bacterium]
MIVTPEVERDTAHHKRTNSVENTGRVTAIIINWRLKEETLGCAQALARQSVPCRVIVVDNGSGDNSVHYLTQTLPEATIIGLSRNVGFGPACNYAIRHHVLAQNVAQSSASNHDFVLLVNNDARLAPDAVAELVKAAQQHPQAGLLGAKVYYSDRPNILWYAGARRRRAVLAATQTGRGERDHGQFDQRQEVDYIFGAAILIRSSVFQTIGLFDERFFLYLEDLDFCLRAQQAGYLLRFVPQAHAWHKGAASTNDQPALRRYHMAKSTIHFLRKHTTYRHSVPIFCFWILVYVRTILADLLRGDLQIIKAYLAGLRCGLRETREVEGAP